MSSTDLNFTSRNTILDQRTGYYIQTTPSGSEHRTSLLNMVETCSSKSKEEREPLMRYFRGILDTKKRYYDPPPVEAQSESSPFSSSRRSGDQIQSEMEREIQDVSQSPFRNTGLREVLTRDQFQTGIPGRIKDPTQTSIQDQTPTHTQNQNLIRTQIPIRSQNSCQTLFQNSYQIQNLIQIPILSLSQNPIDTTIQNQNQIQIQIQDQNKIPRQMEYTKIQNHQNPKQLEYTTPLNLRIDNLSRNFQITTLQPPGPTIPHHPPKTFPKFPLLPTELQLQIWTSSLPGPRIFETSSTGLEFLNRPHDVRTSHLLILNILRACRTSRDVIAKRYSSVRLVMLGWEFPVEYCERPHYLVDFERDVFYFPNADVRVLGRALGRVRNAALSAVEIGFGDGSEDALVPEWVVDGVVSEEERARVREELIVQKSRFREWNGWQEESLPYLEKKPAAGEKFLKSLVLVGDGERVLMGMEDKLEAGTLRDFEYSYWEWVGDEMPLPIERTGLDKEPDHPYWELHGKRLDNVKRAFESELVRRAYEGIEVKFELWRRPRQEGYWERRSTNWCAETR